MSCAWTGGTGYSAKVSVVVDNSHDTYCNGQLIGSGNSWNTPDTFDCVSDDGQLPSPTAHLLVTYSS